MQLSRGGGLESSHLCEFTHSANILLKLQFWGRRWRYSSEQKKQIFSAPLSPI